MISDLKQYYQNLLATHGPSVEAVQHVSTESQYKRFEILTSIAPDINSIIDVGCGLGDMYAYLLQHKYQGKYLGLDFVEEFVAAAKESFQAHSKAGFDTFDITQQNLPHGYDYILLSGVFNNKMLDNEAFMLESIRKMYAACNKGVAFNAMSTYVDFFNDELYYADPLKVFDFCKKELTSKVVLKHDYIVKEGSIPYEFTIFLYKDYPTQTSTGSGL
ncbi:class I SAM-dependent methyltransferase [Colwellia sp. MEBiC06753]